VDGRVQRLRTAIAAISATEPQAVPVIATGGLATLVIAHCATVERHEPDLTLLGLRLIYERNA
jgi:type III pantothenate kinase